MSKPYKEGDILLPLNSSDAPVMVLDPNINKFLFDSEQPFCKVLYLLDGSTADLLVRWIDKYYVHQG